MAGDITRSTFEKRKHYSGVRMQQGRVQMDADWNEQLDIRLYTDRVTNRDVIGACGAPEKNAANANFAVQVQPGGNLLLKQGRIYVGGILCESEFDTLVALPSPAGTVPVQPDLPGVDFTGPGFAFETLLAALGGGPNFTLPSSAGTYTVYLDVWEREITALEDPRIREVALGGPDTATRRKVVWQAKLLFLNEAKTGVKCPVDWDALIPPSTAALAARSTPDPPNTNPCVVPATAGYRRLENQLYRVEVHEGGAAGTATFKFSRDNASITAAWLGQDAANPNNLLVSTLGKDQVLGFAGGEWIEITDDTRELWGLPGTLVQLKAAQVSAPGPTLTIDAATASPAGAITFTDFPRNPKIRRWDQVAAPTVTLTGGAISVQEGAWLDLEDGVQVLFDKGGRYKTGDYWLIPARTATAITNPLVEWPTDPSTTPPTPLRKPAFGIRHSYCSLALLTFDAASGFTFLQDCRNLFPPLTALPAAAGCCCTVTLSPGDITPANTLQSVADSLAGKNATISLLPGVYTLSAPVVLTAAHSNLTFDGCHPDVVIRANPDAFPAFLHGLFVIIGAAHITIRGLRFELPAVPFARNGGRLADLAVAVLQANGSLDTSFVAVGIGVCAVQTTALEIDDCMFHFQVSQLRLFEAGIFLVAACSGLRLRGNTFIHEAPISPTSQEVRFGILHTSTVSNAVIGPQTPNGAVSATAAIVPARLDDASICENLFSGLTAAAFVHAEIGLMRIEENTVQNCYAGFELFGLKFPRNDTQLGRLGSILNDVAFALASAVGEGYPFPPGFDPKTAGQIPVTGQSWLPQHGNSNDPVVAQSFVLDSFYSVIESGAFANAARQLGPLTLFITKNQVDIVPKSTAGVLAQSGPGFVIASDPQDSGSLIFGNNRVHKRGVAPAVSIFYAAMGTATGNEIWNALADTQAVSLAVGPAPLLGVGAVSAIAITGNVLRGRPDLVGHAGAAPPFDRWEVLNQILPA